MKNKAIITLTLIGFLSVMLVAGSATVSLAVPPAASSYEAYPPFLAASVPPLVMLVMGRNHKLYYEAYNDSSDLDGDGTLDIIYKPDDIDYYGYFDSFKYYEYDSTDNRFEPIGLTVNAGGVVDGVGKMAPTGAYWSGDFLNYLTMSRMDTMRKVLYGGFRSTDTATETVLERAFIPQDAHSWGKEYESVANDGYDIRDYTPLDLPPVNTRHLFASTSLFDYTDANYKPLLRVLPNNTHRIWEWVAKERPVCDNSLETGGGGVWEIVPASATAGISGMTQTTYTKDASHPTDHASYNTMLTTFAIPVNLNGSGAASTIDGTGNPFGAQDDYLTIFEGTLNVPVDGTYNLSVDGDDAVELIIDGGDGVFDDIDDTVVAGWYGGHGSCNCNTYSGSIFLTAGAHQFQFRHEEASGGDNYFLRWELAAPASTITDYQVRVLVADATVGLESNCKQYPNGNYKPTGILQRHGESDSMYFGLLTGSYTNNTDGGVLRKAIGSFTDEIVPSTGVFDTTTQGIVHTIDRFRIAEFDYGDHSYEPNWPDAWVTTRPMNDGEFPDWGNPVGEMMYETLRYFSGEAAATNDFYSATMTVDDNLGLPKLGTWTDPYTSYPTCSKPFMLVISDIYPTYDSDIVPGTAFGAMGSTTLGDGGTLDVSTLADKIFTNELSTGNRFIGQNATTDDGACTEKNVDGFDDIRGLCPEEPTKQGSYYSAAVAHFGRIEDISNTAGVQNARTYSVGLASPLPKIEVAWTDQTGQDNLIRLVPFAKSVGGCLGIVPTAGLFQPTNTIVDFFVTEISSHHGRFRINFEDVEQAADHDMDAIAVYDYQLVDAGGNPVTAATVDQAVALDITLTAEYASGCIIQHMGYIISGTTADGTYLEIRDSDTAAGSDEDYFLDTPNTAGVDLPMTHTRQFTPDATGGAAAASLLPNPLWYAAKWGGFDDKNADGTPDLADEWDKDGDDIPDSYFYVVNPLKLEEQLNKTFADILEKAASGTAASVLATNSEGAGHLVQAYFKPRVATTGGDRTWLGYMQSLWVDPWGNLREDSKHNKRLDLTNNSNTSAATDVDRIITYITDAVGDTKIRMYTNHHMYHPKNSFTSDCYLNHLTPPEACPDLTDPSNYVEIALENITPIFEAGDVLRQRDPDTRNVFTFIDGDGTDNDGDGIVDESGEVEVVASKWVGTALDQTLDHHDDDMGEVIRFHENNMATLKPFLGLKDNTAWDYIDAAAPDHDTRVQNLINFIRGKDSADLISNPDCRSRTMDDGSVWKLGDIINSTPISISKPPDYYHLIYGDESFQHYFNDYKDRETVVYVGGNDGMLHAFTSWDYNTSQGNDGIDNDLDGFTDEPDEAAGQYTEPAAASPTEELGDELWAYIPQTLLPHLKFLADPDYAHTFYVDLKPKIFDAQIIADGTHYNDGDGNDDWGTIMLLGLNMGGKEIWAEGDFDGDAMTADTVRNFYPTYVCMDITDPRDPKLLWERSYENLAMTTSFPAILEVGRTRSESGGTYTWSGGKWFAAIGSGPTDYDATSGQNGYVFIIDLKTGEPYHSAGGNEWLFDTGTANTLMNSPVAFDKSLTYNVDGIYFGSIASAAAGGLEGKVFKVNTHHGGSPSDDPANWSMDAMFDSPGPISASISLSTDREDNVWAFFGTGRYQSNADKIDANQQYFIGVKDPYYNLDHDQGVPNDHYLNESNPLELDMADLFNATPYSVHTNQAVTGGVASVTNWGELVTEAKTYDGWYQAMETLAGSPSERVISKSTVLGGIVFFPGYTPNDDICGFGGDTNFYALYYETGTAYYKHILPGTVATVVIGTETTERTNKKFNVGHGAPPPAAGFHVGRESGATAFLQMSTGEVVKINVDTAFPIKSNIAAWRDRNQ